MPIHLIFSIGFASPAMLAWGVAIALPVLIHLWRKRHAGEEPWGPMRLLEEAMGRSRRRLQIERGFLLLLRMLLILLLVLAVAEPVAEISTAASMAPDARVHRVMVIDGSFSMAYRPTDRSRFEQGKEIIQRIIQTGRPGDGYSLIVAGSPSDVVVADPVFEPQRFAQVVDQLRQQDMTLDPLDMLRQTRKVTLRGKAARYEFDRTEIYFLSDLCRVGWSLQDKALAKEARKLAADLSSKATLTVIDLGQADAANGSIAQFHATPSATTSGQPVEFNIETQHFGLPQPRQSLIEFFVNGRSVGRQTLKPAPDGHASTSFSYTFPSSGLHEVECRLQEDQLDVDNHRFLIVPVHDAIRVLLIEGRPGHDPLSTAGGFLKAALQTRHDEAPSLPSSTDSESTQVAVGKTYHVDTIHEGALAETSLAAYDTVALANVAQITATEAKALDRYIHQGGELLLFLGDQVMPDRYNKMLAGLLPAELDDLITFDTPPKLDPMDYRHTIVRPFQSHPESGLLTIPIHRMIRLVTDDHPETQIALATEDGKPLIVEHRVGAGRVVLVATSADTSWTLAPIWPSFVPLVQTMASLGFESIAENLNREVSQPLSGTLNAGETVDRLRIVTPEDQRLPVTAPQDSKKHTDDTWQFTRTEIAGIYRLQEEGKETPGDRFAVNVDPLESDLAKMSKSNLQNDIWPGVRFVYRTTWADQPLDLSTSTNQGNATSRNLLFLGLLLLVLETCWIIRN